MEEKERCKLFWSPQGGKQSKIMAHILIPPSLKQNQERSDYGKCLSGNIGLPFAELILLLKHGC